MDLPHLQPSRPTQRTRTSSNLSVHSIDNRGAIRKRSVERSRSVSSSQADRFQQLSLEEPGPSVPWIAPQQSPPAQETSTTQAIDPFPSWTVPTPPRSDSGIPTVSINANDECAITGLDITAGFPFAHPATTADMSSLGYLLPTQYAPSLYDLEPGGYSMDQHYIPPMRMSQPPSASNAAAYAHAVSSNPALYQSSGSGRRHSEFPSSSSSSSSSIDPSYGSAYRRISNPYDSTFGMQYAAPSGRSMSTVSGLAQNPLPSPPHMVGPPSASSMSNYNPNMARSPSIYDSAVYAPSYSTAPSQPAQLYASAQNLSYPSPMVSNPSNEGTESMGSEPSTRVLNQRPRPQCWEHGCNGRQFSTFSNLLRHQREKSGAATKSYCPRCGAEFTRTTARNGHLAHDKCTRQRGQSDDN